MELAFGTEELRNMCEQEATAIERLGPLPAEALKNRLSDLRAADYISDVLAGRPRAGQVRGLECYEFDLADRYVLTVTANHVPARVTAGGQTDWSRVRRVKVLSVEQ